MARGGIGLHDPLQEACLGGRANALFFDWSSHDPQPCLHLRPKNPKQVQHAVCGKMERLMRLCRAITRLLPVLDVLLGGGHTQPMNLNSFVPVSGLSHLVVDTG